MNRKQLFALTLTILCASQAFAFGPDRGDALGRMLFKPEVIMKFSNRLDLSEQQQETLRIELKDAQALIFDFKWQLNEESEKLKAILTSRPIDEEQMLVQSDRVMEIEHQIKRIHLALLARLKNMLSDEQIQMLKEFRRKERRNGER